MSHNIWTIDASQLDIDSNLDRYPLYRNSLVEDFLRHDDKYVLLGPKGVGKTLLLKLKSHDYRCNTKGTQFYPKNQLCDILVRGETSFRMEEIASFKTVEQWKNVWRLALSVLTLRALGIDVPLGDYDFPYAAIQPSLESILAEVIGNRNRFTSYQHFFSRFVIPIFASVNQPFAAFLDRLDETLGKHTGSSLRLFEEDGYTGEGALSYEAWLNAQFGLIEAVRELREKNPHIKFFVTARHEVLRATHSPTAHNLASIYVDLRYARWELKNMFELKLRALRDLSDRSFIRNDDQDIYKAFFGFSTYAHPRVSDNDGGPVQEHIFDCLLRHTRGSPREIEDIARDIGAMPRGERTPDKVRKIINRKSREFFDYARGAALPYWSNSTDDFLRLNPRNVMKRHEFRSVISNYNKRRRSRGGATTDLQGHPKFLFDHSLLGYAWKEEDGSLRQRFNLNDPDEPAIFEEFCSADYILLHPCLDAYLDAENPSFQRDERNLVGHGKLFNDRKPGLHVHFGAGQLGCGLVVPLVKNARPTISLCLIQRPSARWNVLLQDKIITAKVSISYPDGEESHDFSVISDRVSQRSAHEYIRKWKHGEKDILVLSNSSSQIQEVLRCTQSISTAGRVDAVKDIAAEIALKAMPGRLVALFPFENDERCFSLYREELAGFPRVTTFDVVVDRVCTSQEIYARSIEVTAERFYSVVLYGEAGSRDDAFTLLQVAHGKQGQPSDYKFTDFHCRAIYLKHQAEFDFFHSAKRYIVNGIHCAAAIYGYYEVMSASGFRLPSTALVASQIFQLIVRDPDIKENIAPIARYFALRTALDYIEKTKGSEREMDAKLSYLKELFALAWSRMRQMPDSLDRILPADPEKMVAKWKYFFGRISDVEIGKVIRAGIAAQIDVDVDEAMVQEAWRQLDRRYARVLSEVVSKPLTPQRARS